MVFCPKCGAENKEGARFCAKCGTALATIEREMAPPPPTTPQEKSVVIAIILNLIWGLGYYYLGIKKVYGTPWYYLTILLFIMWILNMILVETPIYQAMMIGEFVFFIGMAYDIYQKGKGRPGLIPS